MYGLHTVHSLAGENVHSNLGFRNPELPLYILRRMSRSVCANSLDVFVSSLDEVLEIRTATQFSKFFTLKKRFGPE